MLLQLGTIQSAMGQMGRSAGRVGHWTETAEQMGQLKDKSCPGMEQMAELLLQVTSLAAPLLTDQQVLMMAENSSPASELYQWQVIHRVAVGHRLALTQLHRKFILKVHQLSANNQYLPIIGQFADNRYGSLTSASIVGRLSVLVSKTTKNAFNCSSR